MQQLGFIHDMVDTKVLILFVMSRVSYPATSQQIYELCLQDDCVSYFNVCEAIPQMVASGHLLKKEDDLYEITQKGRADGALTESSIAYTVRTRAENAADRFNRRLRKSSLLKTQITPSDTEMCTVTMEMDDISGNLMKLQIPAPNQRQAVRLEKLFEKKAEILYNMIMAELLDSDDE